MKDYNETVREVQPIYEMQGDEQADTTITVQDVPPTGVNSLQQTSVATYTLVASLVGIFVLMILKRKREKVVTKGG